MLRMEFQSLNLLPFINSNKIIYTEWSNDGQTWKHSEVQLGSAPRICLTKWIIILPSRVHSHVTPFWNTIPALSLPASKPFFFLQGDPLKVSFKACNSSNSKWCYPLWSRFPAPYSGQALWMTTPLLCCYPHPFSPCESQWWELIPVLADPNPLIMTAVWITAYMCLFYFLFTGDPNLPQ